MVKKTQRPCKALHTGWARVGNAASWLLSFSGTLLKIRRVFDGDPANCHVQSYHRILLDWFISFGCSWAGLTEADRCVSEWEHSVIGADCLA